MCIKTFNKYKGTGQGYSEKNNRVLSSEDNLLCIRFQREL